MKKSTKTKIIAGVSALAISAAGLLIKDKLKEVNYWESQKQQIERNIKDINSKIDWIKKKPEERIKEKVKLFQSKIKESSNKLKEISVKKLKAEETAKKFIEIDKMFEILDKNMHWRSEFLDHALDGISEQSTEIENINNKVKEARNSEYTKALHWELNTLSNRISHKLQWLISIKDTVGVTFNASDLQRSIDYLKKLIREIKNEPETAELINYCEQLESELKDLQNELEAIYDSAEEYREAYYELGKEILQIMQENTK